MSLILSGTDGLSGTTVSVTGNITGNYFIGDGSQLTGISAGGAAPVVTIYSSPATWTKPASLKFVRVTMIASGGGGAGACNGSGARAGGGGGGWLVNSLNKA